MSPQGCQKAQNIGPGCVEKAVLGIPLACFIINCLCVHVSAGSRPGWGGIPTWGMSYPGQKISECGVPERDIESLGVRGWGGGGVGKLFRRRRRRRRRRHRPTKVGVLWKTVSSRLGLRTEISARYYRETTRTDVPHLFLCS